VTAAALVLLRSTVDRPQGRSVVDGVATVSSSSPRPTPPYDRRPGRTPIPDPARRGDALSGPLPPVGGGPTKRSAGASVDLVLGRYCLDPRRYTFTLDPDRNGTRDHWHHVNVLVFGLDDSSSGPALRLFLDWTGASYRWLGFLTLLDGC